MDVSIYVKNAIAFYFRIDNDSMKELRKNLKLNLRIHENKKCEYCDWNNNYCWCEWCGKSSCSNKRKLETVQKKKKKETILFN